MKKDKKIRFTGFLSGRITIGNIRIIIGALFIVLFLIIILYHLYFETEIVDSERESTKLPKLSKINSSSILDNASIEMINFELSDQDLNYTTIEFRNPSILRIENRLFLMAFEVRLDQTSSIWLIESIDGKTWSQPWHLGINLPDLNNPSLENTKGKELMITYDSGGKRYMQVSKTGHTWSLPIIWEHDQIDETVYYGNHYIMASNQTGLWLSKFSGDIIWEQLLNESFENSSILMKNEFKFQIVSEDAKNNFESLTLTDLDFIVPETKRTELKWDLLVLFIILGLILLTILVNEVARE